MFFSGFTRLKQVIQAEVLCLHVHLVSPEMRSKFDQGEDPMDPESQQGGGHHHHFHGGWENFHGFNPFGSGPFNFKFNYN